MIARFPISVLLRLEKTDDKVILIFHMMKISIKSNSIMNHARVSFFMVMLMLPLLGHAQQVAYDYDASGNRISRSAVVNSRRAMTSDGIQLFSAAPNPVSDILQIKYEDEAAFSGSYEYSLQGIYGDTALSGVSSSPRCNIDVSGISQGVYILHIIYKEEEQSIKIIKK